MPPVLRTVDIFVGLALVMLLLSMIITVITQIITNLLNSRGKHLLQGVADILEQLDRGITREIAKEIAEAVLTNPLVSSAKGKLGNVIHREELSKLLLDLGAGDGPSQLSEKARTTLQVALVKNGICQPGTPEEIQQQIRKKIADIRASALQLEKLHPDLTNAARARMAMLDQASSQFLAKINLWFDQTMDRVSERFTAHTRYVTFFAGLAVALGLELDTAMLVSRLSSDDNLRQSLVDMATKEAAGGSGAQGSSTAVSLNAIDRQNLKDLVTNNVIGIPQSWTDWRDRWTPDNFLMKALGILLTTFLLSLGAPFWYNTLQNTIRLRSVLATKDDDQRKKRQVSGATSIEGRGQE